ncbi:MAG: alanine--glyoxylate aminotransferase family protein [Planctomycetia bacterium]|nr:alanine--glyoxylate aminotransferase family protein [Planctomycetia bacterium]
MKNPLLHYRLMTPGPTPVPPSALKILGQEIKHHRTEEFREIFRRAIFLLQEIFCTQNKIAIMCGSGTAAMEACVVNAVPAGGKALVLYSGKFAERWAHLCKRFGITPILYEVPWGEVFLAEKVAEFLQREPDIQAVFSTLSETSTGVGHRIQEIGREVAKTDALFVVDGISGVGGMECRTDAWGIDLLAVGSQKALMTPPGLAFVAVSEKAWRKMDTTDIYPPAFYLDLRAYRKSAETWDTPYTPSRTLIAALAENLRILSEIGVENIWAHTSRMARSVRAAMKAMNLEIFAKEPCDVLTLVKMPEKIHVSSLLTRLEEEFGVKIAGAQGDLKGRAIRIAHMGFIDYLDLIGCVAALEQVLISQKWPITPGTGLTAMQKKWLEKTV